MEFAIIIIIILPCELGLSRKSWQKHKKIKTFYYKQKQ